jgi:hypothetical protein
MLAQQDVRITVHELFGEPRDFTLSYPLDPEHDRMLATIHREYGGRRARCGQVIEDRMHPRLPRAVRGTPALWLTLASIPDPQRGVNARRWRLGHWPGSGMSGGHDVPSLMHADHAEKQEYVAARIDEHGAGFCSGHEKSVARGTRSDVVAFDQAGSPVATFEIQNASLSSGLAVRRDRAVERAGIPATWLGPTDSRPAWAEKVAWMGANRREGFARGTWTVTSGRRVIEMEPCQPGARQDCLFGSGWCGESHPLWRPVGGTVDDVVDGILAGELHRFDTGTRQGIIVASTADCQRWIDYMGAPKVAKRAGAAARRKAADGSVAHNDGYSEAKILAGMPDVPPVVELARKEAPACSACRKPTWSVGMDGRCRGCRLNPALPPPLSPPPVAAASRCRGCGERLIAVYPGQQFHPTCDPAPVTLSTLIAEGRI